MVKYGSKTARIERSADKAGVAPEDFFILGSGAVIPARQQQGQRWPRPWIEG